MSSNACQNLLPLWESAWREIDPSAIVSNYRAIRAAIGPGV